MSENLSGQHVVCNLQKRITVYATVCDKIAIKEDFGDDKEFQVIAIEPSLLAAFIRALRKAKEDCK